MKSTGMTFTLRPYYGFGFPLYVFIASSGGIAKSPVECIVASVDLLFMEKERCEIRRWKD